MNDTFFNTEEYEEALKVVRGWKENIILTCQDGLKEKVTQDLVITLIKALNARIKKPHNFGMAQGQRWWSCPACCSKLLTKSRFCDQCGQAIDWGK